MHPAARQSPYAYPAAHRFSPAAIVGIGAAHAAILALLVSLNVVPLPTSLIPLMVQIIPQAATPEITPPRPKAPERKVTPQPAPVPRQQPQMIAAQTQAANAESSTPQVKEAPPAAAAPAASFSQARFDADYLQNPPPAYPSMSKRLREEGKVILRVHVEVSGRPGQIEIKTSSGSPRLDQAALEAVTRWKFIAARRGDEVVAAWVLVPIIFNLKD